MVFSLLLLITTLLCPASGRYTWEGPCSYPCSVALREKRWALSDYLQRSDSVPLPPPATTESASTTTEEADMVTVVDSSADSPANESLAAPETPSETATVALDVDTVDDPTTTPIETTTPAALEDGSIDPIDDKDQTDDEVSDGTLYSEGETDEEETTTALPEQSNSTVEERAPQQASAFQCFTTNPGFWGEDCTLLCNCEKNSACRDDGICQGNCKEGFKGPKCDEPYCVENCGMFGKCTSHNRCTCTGHYVAEQIGVTHENGTETVQHQCISVRMKGLKGCVAALIVLIISISFCGLVQHSAEKRFERAYSYINNN